ncbi:2466_t:CDS:2, partial [Dentiscutata erythropus]
LFVTTPVFRPGLFAGLSCCGPVSLGFRRFNRVSSFRYEDLSFVFLGSVLLGIRCFTRVSSFHHEDSSFVLFEVSPGFYCFAKFWTLPEFRLCFLGSGFVFQVYGFI